MKAFRRSAVWSVIALLSVLLLVLSCSNGEDSDHKPDDEDDDDSGDDAAFPTGAAGYLNPPHPFEAAEPYAGQWVWIPLEDFVCRDGSTSGLGVRLQPGSDGLVIFLKGGGFCDGERSCAANRDRYDAADFADEFPSGGGGLLNAERVENPVRDWSFIFVPYCTGDLHGGDAQDVVVPGVSWFQQFVGRRNMELVVDLSATYFEDLRHVLLAGGSAGGMGAMFNYALTAESFAPLSIVLVNDSGPLFESDEVLSPCMQKTWRDLWNLDAVLPEGCDECRSVDGDGLVYLLPYLAEVYPDGSFGLLARTGDLVVREMLGRGQDDCTSNSILPESMLRVGLLGLRDDLLVPTGRWSTYFQQGLLHCFIAGDSFFYHGAVGGDSLLDWFTGVLSSQPTQVGPETN